MIRFYLDENVEGPIVRGLRLRGVDLLTAEEDGRAATPDPEILDRATSLNRLVFSRDQDFLREATRRQRHGDAFGGVVYAHKSRVSIGQCIEDLAMIAEIGSLDEFTGRVWFLPL